MLQPIDRRELRLRLLPACPSMAGLCVAALGFMNSTLADRRDVTVPDLLLSVCALLFLLATVFAYASLRTMHERRERWCSIVFEGAFVFGLSGLVITALFMVYASV